MKMQIQTYAAACCSLLLLGGCESVGQTIKANPYYPDGSAYWYEKAGRQSDAEAAKREVWCYHTLGEIECFHTPQRDAADRLVMVDPAERYPIDRDSYTQSVVDAEKKAVKPDSSKE